MRQISFGCGPELVKLISGLVPVMLVVLAACAGQPSEPVHDTGTIIGEVGDPRNRAKLGNVLVPPLRDFIDGEVCFRVLSRNRHVHRLAVPSPVGLTHAVFEVADIGREVEVSTVVSQGCRPIGDPFVVTKAEEDVVHELGGHQGIVTRVGFSTDGRLVDLHGGEADIAIRAGLGEWDGLEAELLMPIDYTPMASPGLLKPALVSSRMRTFCHSRPSHASQTRGGRRGSTGWRWPISAGPSSSSPASR